MKRQSILLAALTFVFSIYHAQADVINSRWVGGEKGSWSNASNWDPAIVPDNGGGNTFVVVIDSNSLAVEKIKIFIENNPPGTSWPYDVNEVHCYGTVELTGLGLTLLDTNGLTNHGQLEIWVGEVFDIVGNVYNVEGALIMGGFDIEDGNLVNAVGASLINGTYEVEVEGSIYNHGRVLSAEAGHLLANQELHNFGSINIYSAICEAHGSFTNYEGAAIRGYGMIHSGKFFENQGLIESFGGDLILSLGLDPRQTKALGLRITDSGKLANAPGTSLTIIPSVCDVNNGGTIEMNADGSMVFDCNLVNEPNAVIRLLGGTLAAETITQSACAAFEGFGGITGDVFIEANGVIDVNGPANIVGDVNIKPNATLEIRDGNTLIRGHTTCNNGTIHMIGGRVICQGGLTNNNCNIVWEPGTYTNMADFNLDGTVNFKDYTYFADVWLWKSKL
jgi:hypothetical protein